MYCIFPHFFGQIIEFVACAGACYESGRGVARDLVEAARLYKLAVDQYHANAQSKLGRTLKAFSKILVYFLELVPKTHFIIFRFILFERNSGLQGFY